jgi:ATP-dependent DNA ligase
VKASSQSQCCFCAPGACPTVQWLHELKLDGYGALAINSGDEVQFRSRNDNDFGLRYPAVTTARLSPFRIRQRLMADWWCWTKPGDCLSLLQNYGSRSANVYCFGSDLVVLPGKDMTASR